jgi:hypothetical protein
LVNKESEEEIKFWLSLVKKGFCDITVDPETRTSQNGFV